MRTFPGCVLLVAIFALLFSLTGCGAGNASFTQPPPPTNTLAYLHRSSAGNNYTIYDLKVLHGDGSVATLLSSQSLISAVLSPNGQKILYSYYDPNVVDYQIATMNADGSANTVLTGNGSFGLYPQYTPDGSKIVYEASGIFTRSIAVMNADGTSPLIINAAFGNQYCFPSTNGSIIAASVIIGASQGLATMNMDGSNQQVIVNSAYFSYSTFNGNQIVFSTSDGHNYNLYTVNPDGTNLTQITNSLVNWDPLALGGSIYFVSVPSSVQNPNTDSQQIFSMKPVGSNPTAVTNDTLYDGFKTANGFCLNP
ncbi:MAG TPA: DUF5050 domain-containing protein [Candidatus Solibacter sp.]|nr:DUF5050 domain-containing protein [Candidatus Solibacter sp.]